MAVLVSSVEKWLESSAEEVLGTVVTPGMWLILVALALLPCSYLYLCVSALLVFGFRETEVESLFSALKGWRS